MTETGLQSLGLEPEDEQEGRSADRRDRKRSRRALWVLLTLVLIPILVVGGFAAYLFFTVENNISHAPLLPANGPITAPDGSPVETSGTGTNFLLIGSDSRGTDQGRSDVIVLVHIPKDPTSVYMVHFPRDLYVDIPGHGKNKINASYAYGGAPLLVQTLQNLLGVKIDHVAKTDFTGFKDMTDAVGGVRVYAEEGNDARGNGGTAIQKGWNDLNGEQALGFVRERYELSEGDISRGRRQLAFVKALLLKATSPQTLANPVKIAQFTDAATKNLVVDDTLTLGAMKDYAFELKNIRGGDVVFSTAPFSGFAMDPKAGAIDIVDESRMKALGDALRTDTMDQYGDVFVTP